MPKLTNKMRQETLDKIMAATNFTEQREDLLKRFFNWCTSYAKAHLPPDFAEKTKGVPREWLATRVAIEVDGRFNPITITGPENKRGNYYYRSAPIEAMAVPVTLIIPDPVKDAADVLSAPIELQWLVDAANNWVKAYDEVEEAVRKTLYAYSSTDKLIKDFPQFHKHLDIPSAVRALTVPPAKLSALLTATGFDKTEN